MNRAAATRLSPRCEPILIMRAQYSLPIIANCVTAHFNLLISRPLT